MSKDPAYPLQKAVFDALEATTLKGTVFHTIPAKQSLPYIKIGDDDFVAEYDAGDFTRATVTLVLADATKPKLKLSVAITREALDKQLSVAGFVVAEWQWESTTYYTAPDGMTEHAALTVEYLLMPA